MNSEFWRRINELKIQLQSLNRIEGFQVNDEESHAKNIVKPKILSRLAFTCRKCFSESSVS